MAVRSLLSWFGIRSNDKNLVDDFVCLVDTTSSVVPLPLGVGWTVLKIVSPVVFETLSTHPIVSAMIGLWWLATRHRAVSR